MLSDHARPFLAHILRPRRSSSARAQTSSHFAAVKSLTNQNPCARWIDSKMGVTLAKVAINVSSGGSAGFGSGRRGDACTTCKTGRGRFLAVTQRLSVLMEVSATAGWLSLVGRWGWTSAGDAAEPAASTLNTRGFFAAGTVTGPGTSAAGCRARTPSRALRTVISAWLVGEGRYCGAAKAAPAASRAAPSAPTAAGSRVAPPSISLCARLARILFADACCVRDPNCTGFLSLSVFRAAFGASGCPLRVQRPPRDPSHIVIKLRAEPRCATPRVIRRPCARQRAGLRTNHLFQNVSTAFIRRRFSVVT